MRLNLNKPQLAHLAQSDVTGFTLIEVLISMTILVFISFAIFQATTETYKLRDVLSQEGDFYNGIRLSTGIIQRDIAMLYSPTISVPYSKPDPHAPPDPRQMQVIMSDDLGQTSLFWLAAIDSSGLRPSHFIGTETKLSFVSLSHTRIYRDSPESEFAKITYEIKKDDKNTDNPSTFVLVKTESPNAFANEDQKDTFSHSFELLHGVKKLSYSYYQREGLTWKIARTWDSEKEETKNRYPDIIELKIEVVSKKQAFEGKFKFRPEIPLNGLNPSI